MSLRPARGEAAKASPRMFDSDLLDWLSRVHPSVPVIIYVPAIAALLAWGFSGASAATVIGLLALGYALWTLVEYWLHRIVFHFEPDHGLGARMHWIIHGVHHEHPNDPLRLVMPPSVRVPIAALFVWIFYLVFGAPLVAPVTAGFFTGYLAYDMIHFYVHHGHPRNPIARILRERHMRHHFQDDTRGFGVSAPYWDEVFRTAPRTRGTAAQARGR